MNGNTDPRIDKMMASLYGELPEAEERAFRRLLEKDDALRMEYEELAGTRDMLAGWEVEELVPSFVLVEGTAARRAPSAPAGDGLWDRLVAAVRSFAVTPAWGLAAAAGVVLVLAMADFRVQRVDGGIAFRFGEASTPQQVASTPTPEQGASFPDARDLAIDGLPTTRPSTADSPGNVVTPVSTGFVTQEELDHNNAQFMLSLTELLNAYGRQRDQRVSEGFQTLYQQVVSQQNYDYQELAGRIDVLGRELLLETDRSQRGFEAIGTALQPDTATAPTGNEEEK
jgi:hypothetical protein